MKINLIEYFLETLGKFPNRTAIIDGERQLTFSEVDVKARQLAKVIVDTTNCKCRPVAMFLPKSVESLVTDLAITYSGNVYMNLDVKNPSERLGNILDLIRPVAIVTSSRFMHIMESMTNVGVRVINIDEIDSEMEAPSSKWFLDHVGTWKDKRLARFCVGGSPNDNPDVEVMLHKLLTDEQRKYIAAFYCQGGFNYEKTKL